MKILIIGGLAILTMLAIFGKIVDALYSISYQLEEIKKLNLEIGRLKLEVQKANKEAQHYFDLLMEKIGNE